jgi:aryl carrier-like protein|tara:strand:- start:890 stop:1171 length:282 start_codon:yes stop_codon:yes gene_type:complete
MSIICVALALSLGWIHIIEWRKQERIEAVASMPDKDYLKVQKNVLQKGMERLRLAEVLDQMREQGKREKKEEAGEISGDDRDWLNSLLATVGE